MRLSQPDGDCWGPGVYLRNVFGARIGWDRSQRLSGNCSNGKKELTRDQRMLEIFGSRPTPVGEVWLEPVLIQDICSVLTSVEDVDAPTEVPVGLSPCDYVGGSVGRRSERSIDI